MQHQFLSVAQDLIKGSISPDFAEDILNYSKYLAVKDCSEEKRSQLQEIFEVGRGQDFAEFCVKEVPEFAEKLQKYISLYENA